MAKMFLQQAAYTNKNGQRKRTITHEKRIKVDEEAEEFMDINHKSQSVQ